MMHQDGNTALTLAASGGYVETVNVLVTKGADLEARTEVVLILVKFHLSSCLVMNARSASIP